MATPKNQPTTEAEKAAKRVKRHKVIAIAEGIVIGTVIVLAIGFYLGDHYANNKNAQMQSAVTTALTTKK